MKGLAGLGTIAGARRDAAESRLAALRREEADLRGKLAALEAARRERAGRALVCDLALRAGADLRWEAWVGTRTALLLAELARILARIEGARAELGREVGRDAALAVLLSRERALRVAAQGRAEERRLASGTGPAE